MLEKYIAQLYRELAAKGLSRFHPPCYLSDEWACPDREPIIGIPFYLADPKLAALEKAINDIEDEREIMMYLRHEAGHAFNYAYVLYESKEWRQLFGDFDKPYDDHYKPVPFSRRFVRHIAGWYAQKHPDEDFGAPVADQEVDRDHRQAGAGAGSLRRHAAGAALSHRDGRVRHGAGDELPDARPIRGALMLKIAVLYEPSDNTAVALNPEQRVHHK